MKALILVFSQSGNTLKVAQAVQKEIREKGWDCQTLDLCGQRPEKLPKCDMLGIGCPVFYYQEPFNVKEFLLSLPRVENKPAFAFCTHGSVPGQALFRLHQHLAGKGYSVTGTLGLYGDAFVPFYPHPTFTTGHPDETDLDLAKNFGGMVAETGQAVLEGRSVELPPPPKQAAVHWKKQAEVMTPGFMKKVFPALGIDPEKCTQCGECILACPVQGVDPTADPPIIQDPCIWCWNCVKNCPEEAMTAHWDKLIKMAPKQYSLYRKELDKEAENGRFRWLIDPDAIDPTRPMVRDKQNR